MALYARINGNDNIFKGLSSFALEMTELDAILTRTESQGENVLVMVMKFVGDGGYFRKGFGGKCLG